MSQVEEASVIIHISAVTFAYDFLSHIFQRVIMLAIFLIYFSCVGYIYVIML
jgi:hypothetical protein